jgi:hypothetical protein
LAHKSPFGTRFHVFTALSKVSRHKLGQVLFPSPFRAVLQLYLVH